MKKYRVLSKTTKVDDLSLDDLYDDSDYEWTEKSRNLQARRWQIVKQKKYWPVKQLYRKRSLEHKGGSSNFLAVK